MKLLQGDQASEPLLRMVEREATHLRERRRVLYGNDAAAIQREAVRALRAIGAPDKRIVWKVRAAADEVTVPARALAGMSLDAMLDGWSEAELWRLIDSEGVRDLESSPALALHVVAANTPLLVWSSVARALLIGAASLVRLPQESPEIDFWARQFQNALANASPKLAELVSMTHWPSDDFGATREAACASDAVLVYGSDATVENIRALTPRDKRFVGYGHRFSIGVVGTGADYAAAARGTALDMLIFDQQGCLSPQIIFVEGESDDAARFAAALRQELNRVRGQFPARSAATVAKLREASMMARFQPGAAVSHDLDFAWLVATAPSIAAPSFGLPGYIAVAPIGGCASPAGWLKEQSLSERLQGVSYVAGANDDNSALRAAVYDLGASYVCSPGWLQRPPFSWREDNLDVLKSLT